ncbi:MAG: zinc ribbon domain-containing protein [Armatimonadetes bacterium]|nr:zinc ribbon domain-containing protein [Armatimonadota bacterium]
MPIYEYGCHDCRKRVSVFYRTVAAARSKDPECPRCGGSRLTRLVSRVTRLRSDETRLESLADPSGMSALENGDPRTIARWMKDMSREMGEDLGGEFHEVVDRLEAGEDPESIEKTLGDLGGASDDWSPPE